MTTDAAQLDINVTMLDEQNKRAAQPRTIKTPMKPHQLTMLNACLDIENDEMNKKKFLSASPRVK